RPGHGGSVTAASVRVGSVAFRSANERWQRPFAESWGKNRQGSAQVVILTSIRDRGIRACAQTLRFLPRRAAKGDSPDSRSVLRLVDELLDLLVLLGELLQHRFGQLLGRLLVGGLGLGRQVRLAQLPRRR